jgi:hypothetical protein
MGRVFANEGVIQMIGRDRVTRLGWSKVGGYLGMWKMKMRDG